MKPCQTSAASPGRSGPKSGGAEDFRDFSGETHARFALDAVQLEAPDDIAAARDLEDW